MSRNARARARQRLNAEIPRTGPRATLVEAHVAVVVPEGQDPAQVSAEVTARAYTLKSELKNVVAFSVQTRELPVQSDRQA